MSPARTVEVRWFLPGPLPGAIRAWFARLGPEAEPERRTDRYLAPAGDALGVKLREGQVEAKRREGPAGRLAVGTSEAPIEAWVKWSFPLADGVDSPDDGWIEVAKVRWQRRVEAGGGTCTVEISEIEVAGDVWGAVCLEASGPDPEAQRAALDAASAWLARSDAPDLPASAAMGYPAWLRSLSVSW